MVSITKLNHLSLTHSPAGLLYLNLEGKCIYANPSALKFFNLTISQIKGRHIHDLIHSNSLDHHLDDCPVLKIITTSTSIFRRPFTYTNGQGELVWVESSIIPLFDQGQMVATAIYFIPASLAYNSEKEYTNIREIYKSVFETVEVSIFIVDQDFKILQANLAARHLFDRNNLTGLSFVRLFHPDSRFTIRNFIHNVVKIDSFRSLVSIKSEDSNNIYLDLNGSSHIQPNQHLIIIRDVTRDIVEKMERNQFAAIISHEIKNPLAVIKAFTQLLQRRLRNHSDQSVDKYLSKIDDKVDFIANLITNLTDALRLGTGQLNFKDEIIDFDDHIKSIVLEHQKTTATHMIKLTGQTGKNIKMDPHRLNQVVSNLINNAIKYSPSADKVELVLSVKDNQVQLKVVDYGVGIDPDSRPLLYRPFYRGSNVDHNFPGLGLGLYLSKSIVSRYNGRLLFKSKVGKGSTFIVRLPAVS